MLEYQAIFATIIALTMLLLLILKYRMNAFIALLTCSIFAALLAGMPSEVAFKTIQSGFGGTLGFIAPVIGLGAIFGAIMEQSGAIGVLARRIEKSASTSKQTYAAGVMGLIASIPVFFDVALIILLPFIKNLASKAGKPAMFFGLPLCAGLAVGHAFIPPTPGPIAIADLMGANLGHVIAIGAITGFICIIIAGPLLVIFLDNKNRLPGITEPHQLMTESNPSPPTSFGTALSIMLFPILLIMVGTIGKMFLPDGNAKYIISVAGHPFTALILACALSWFYLRPTNKTKQNRLKEALTKAMEPTALVILVTGAGGAFKQVLVDTGAGAQVAQFFMLWGLAPVILAFSLALILRLAQGSATVAMITAAGLMAPIAKGIDPSQWQLAVLCTAIAAGATGFSHVNDSGFWLVSRLFNLTEKETLKSWTLSTGLISLTGLLVSLALYALFG